VTETSEKISQKYDTKQHKKVLHFFEGEVVYGNKNCPSFLRLNVIKKTKMWYYRKNFIILVKSKEISWKIAVLRY